jgi:hypothetical protein
MEVLLWLRLLFARGILLPFSPSDAGLHNIDVKINIVFFPFAEASIMVHRGSKHWERLPGI